jgi:hypothetical protein
MRKLLRYSGLLAVATVLAFSVPQHAAAAETMTGCLETTATGFALNASGERLEVTGDVDFERHAGHTVKLTGEESGNSFRVTALEHVSPTCDSSTNSSTAAANRLTATDQGTSDADIETTAKIRRAIVDDDNLSTLAHNVTIVTRDGRVTLRGNVRSMQEKTAVAAKAEAVAGSAVDNQLTVDADSKESIQEGDRTNGK